ncbi:MULTISPECIES: SRPBCC domain-containing protein [Streptomyces]|jgi:carbon monoxide dehydrogenase subunit G|uniref:SRPBCC domain-containing protein n=1 Tax=Streptomyces TaxID=1883 RepID=UPI000D38B130|nr:MULTISPECIES: SRPBCC domain-containing protein [Streptomyces]MBY8343064.1 SRPBCC family protein [Streptomyces plumbidurans]PTM95781.1 carbon monoxide dehydrogenase subunit G [Streptomyces sp. VMFN-G11Ma]
MEHEVFVPVPAQRLKEALADQAKVARAVPGLQQDAGAEPVTGRLKVRVGSHSVTYRGTVRVVARGDGSYTAEGDVAETRGTGSVKLALTLRVEAADDGSRLVFGGTASADGRVTEMPSEQVAAAATRLLNRFAESLGELAAEQPAQEASKGSASESAAEAKDSATEEEAGAADAGHTSVFDTEVPPPSLDPLAQDETEAVAKDEAGAAKGEGGGDPTADSAPPAEAAHARRTMIGRSAEEVDHAPPRGRYAPVPAPQSVTGGSPLRWAAPAAALALASAIVVSRALRKRR